ncbi:hypothetical protein [Mycolicibacter sinensis]|uniref:Uncharacterized protein n=1 Tax=Mycolicibacter sinensis (strain JDM601) TaxID=875328 RepID=A0A1A3U9H5_MYCSD|nr:hypothetical protein [Mycolicibacter sinensis]OBK91489.1 hypothetical protein A5648_14095 [Mycolicibacter sinensis]
MTSSQCRPTGRKGRDLRKAVLAAYELAEHEQALLDDAAATVDLIEELSAQIERDGLMTEGGRVHPAVAEVRQQRITLARLLVALRIPTEDDADGDVPQIQAGARTQRRGLRGIYAVGGN